MSQKIDYYARTETQIPLMSDKLTDVVGNTVVPFFDKDKQREFFDQMLDKLASLDCVEARRALETIKVLLIEIESLASDISILSYDLSSIS